MRQRNERLASEQRHSWADGGVRRGDGGSTCLFSGLEGDEDGSENRPAPTNATAIKPKKPLSASGSAAAAAAAKRALTSSDDFAAAFDTVDKRPVKKKVRAAATRSATTSAADGSPPDATADDAPRQPDESPPLGEPIYRNERRGGPILRLQSLSASEKRRRKIRWIDEQKMGEIQEIKFFEVEEGERGELRRSTIAIGAGRTPSVNVYRMSADEDMKHLDARQECAALKSLKPYNVSRDGKKMRTLYFLT